MTLFEALILGIVQGVTEFLPVSSSTHLQLARWFLGLSENAHSRYFDLVCHAGTISAAAIYLRKQIIEILTTLRLALLFFLAILPLIPAYFLTKPLRESLVHPSYAGYGLLITAAILWLASQDSLGIKKQGNSRQNLKEEQNPLKNITGPVKQSSLHQRKSSNFSTSITSWKWKDMLCIGSMQALALMPGISRSGSTMAAAYLRGWSWLEAAHFSFLLAIPSVLGGQCLETIKLLREPASIEPLLPWSSYLVGFLTAFSFGFFTIRYIFRIYESFNLLPFICYCAALGLSTLVIFHA